MITLYNLSFGGRLHGLKLTNFILFFPKHFPRKSVNFAAYEDQVGVHDRPFEVPAIVHISGLHIPRALECFAIKFYGAFPRPFSLFEDIL